MDLEPNDIGGPSDRAKFVELLMRSIRTGALYTPGHPKRRETIERAHVALTPIFEISSSLCFEMTAGGFRVQNEVIDTDDVRELGRRISVGGLALLELTRGISVEALDALTSYISLDLENMRLEDDLVTLLWEVEWHNVRWEAVEVPTTPVDDEPSSYDSTVGIADEPTPPPLTSDELSEIHGAWADLR